MGVGTMVTIYGSEQCPKTVKILELCRENGIEVDYMNITKDLKSAWKFAVLRDADPAFDETKKNKRMGIPCVICENGVTFDGGEEPFDAAKVMSKIEANSKK